MAVSAAIIDAVRVSEADGSTVEYAWRPDRWYLIRDDRPYLDIRVRGKAFASEGKLEPLVETTPDGGKWHRWSLEKDLAYHRRFGEVSLPLKTPKNCTLRVYVVPAFLLSYGDVISMIEDIEGELDRPVAWDLIKERPERSWSRDGGRGQSPSPASLVRLVDAELRSALAVRHDPFTELGPRFRRRSPLAENAVVSHWALRRQGQLSESAELIAREIAWFRSKADKVNPQPRQQKINEEIKRLYALAGASFFREGQASDFAHVWG